MADVVVGRDRREVEIEALEEERLRVPKWFGEVSFNKLFVVRGASWVFTLDLMLQVQG